KRDNLRVRITNRPQRGIGGTSHAGNRRFRGLQRIHGRLTQNAGRLCSRGRCGGGGGRHDCRLRFNRLLKRAGLCALGHGEIIVGGHQQVRVGVIVNRRAVVLAIVLPVVGIIRGRRRDAVVLPVVRIIRGRRGRRDAVVLPVVGPVVRIVVGRRGRRG